MKYFFDTEFIEDGKTIDLISIGIVCEDGREYYGINSDCDLSKASAWVRANVISLLPKKNANLSDPSISPRVKQESMAWKPRGVIRSDVADFLGAEESRCPVLGSRFAMRSDPDGFLYSLREGSPAPEIWAYYADYDWVVFCQLFGTMMKLPEGFPMYCRDIKQECDRLGNPKLPEQQNEHNALADARWVRDAFEFLQSHQKEGF